MYDFIWGDFCDWYIEILKIKANDNPDSAEAIFENAINIFEDAIKLLHPVMPFITEELWQGIKERKENESITLRDMPGFNEGKIDDDAERKIELIQQLMSAARNMRAEMGLSPSVKCDITVNCKSMDDAELLNGTKNYIMSLAKIETLDIETKQDAPQYKSVTSVVGPYQLYLKIEGLIDVEQEKAKLNKEIERTEGFINSVNKKLSNEKFVNNASPDVVANEKKKLEDNIQKLEKLKEHYKLIVS